MSETTMESVIGHENVKTNSNPTNKVEKKKYTTDVVECHEIIALIQQLMPTIHDSILTNFEKIVKESVKNMDIKINDQTASIVRIAKKLDETLTNKGLEELSLGSSPKPETKEIQVWEKIKMEE